LKAKVHGFVKFESKSASVRPAREFPTEITV
jgi:hypothetical protein